jgi:uncharacterized protein (DUF697 family)
MDFPGRERLNAYRERLLSALLSPTADDDSVPVTAGMPVPLDPSASSRADAAEREVLGHARAAAALGVLPLVDLIAVTSVQGRMLRRLGHLNGVTWNTELARDFVARLGPGIASGMVGHTVGRSVLKVIPFLGQTAGAAWSARSSAISTYAIGKAADYYLRLHAAGETATAAALRGVHAKAAGTAVASVKRLLDPDAP